MLKIRFWFKSLIFRFAKISGLYYQTPANLNYWWNFGAFSLYFLLAQILTGIFLAMFYNPSALFAYSILMEINNEIYYGWLIRYLHANGASFLFISVYVHLFRGIYYGSFAFPRQLLWISGVVLLILMIITAFFGYILPWGQMSFWGAMVITNLISSIPFIGSDLIFLLWGSYSIDDITLHRFYSLHFVFPFIIFIIAVIHLLFLHEQGSNNPTGVFSVLDLIPFTPYYVLKDGYSLILLLLFLFYIITLAPDLFNHVVNYDRANFLTTPSHIVPEWYFLFFYAILRSVTNKFMGFFLMISSILVFFFLSYLLKGFLVRSSMFKPWHGFWFWYLVAVCILLTWIGSLPVVAPYIKLGQFLSIFYFFILIIFFPLGGPIERLVYDVYIYEARKFDGSVLYFKYNLKFSSVLFYFIYNFVLFFIKFFFNIVKF